MRMTLPPPSAELMQGAELIAVGISQVCEIEAAGGTVALTRRVFDGGSAVRRPSPVPSVGFLRRLHIEADGPPIPWGRGLTVNRLGDEKHGPTVEVDSSSYRVFPSRLATHGAEQGVVELLRPGHVVGADHHMAEHEQSPPLALASASREEREINLRQQQPEGGIMRLILSLLAVAQIRLARHDLMRSDLLMRDADEAFARSRQRVNLANDLARRAGFEVRD